MAPVSVFIVIYTNLYANITVYNPLYAALKPRRQPERGHSCPRKKHRQECLCSFKPAA